MRFRILGPLEACAHDGASVRIRSARQRTLLALLLLHANRPVGVDRLVGVLWPDAPPRSAASNLRTYVSALRQALHLTGGDHLPQLTIQPGGYRLDLPRSEFDLLLFEDLAASGWQALDRGDHAGAAGMLHEALGLWRGRPAEDVTLDEESGGTLARLTERRLAAEQAWIDAQLALGNDAQLITTLRDLVAEYPLQERLWGQLMTALYRTGRQADALSAFQELRRQVTEELGVEPGPSLQRLQQQILTGTVPPPAADRAGHASLVLPAQLPPDVVGFTGRAAQLRWLNQALAAARDVGRPVAPVISTISGTAGVGKTALAVHWAHQVAELFRDGQLHIDLQGYAAARPVDPLDALARFLHALGIPAEQVPGDLDDAAALYRSLLAGRRMLILLDNAATSGQVRPLLPGSPGCLVLVTSRNRLSGLTAREGAARVTLDPLTENEAISLLRTILGADRVKAESAAAAEIAGLCVRLPLALRIAADRALDRPQEALGGLAGELAATRSRLDVLAAADDASTAVRTVLSWSYRALGPDAARMFRLLGVHPGAGFNVVSAAALAGVGHSAARQLLRTLASEHLLEEVAPGCYEFHDLLRLYATERTEAEDSVRDRTNAQHRILARYLRPPRPAHPHPLRSEGHVKA